MKYETKDLHIGMRGEIDYPGIDLHGKEAVIERFCGGDVFLSCELGKFWVWHTHFQPAYQDHRKLHGRTAQPKNQTPTE
jgi:hypothetical protein